MTTFSNKLNQGDIVFPSLAREVAPSSRVFLLASETHGWLACGWMFCAAKPFSCYHFLQLFFFLKI